MVTIKLKIHKVVWQRPMRGAIFTGWVVEDDMPSQQLERVVIPSLVGTPDMLSQGQWWQITGLEELYNGDKQIKASEAYMLRPNGSHIIDLLVGDSGRFAGIGKAYAKKLYDKLGKQLAILLNNNDDITLADVMKQLHIPGADEVATGMVKGWAELGVGEVISWLDRLPSSEKLGKKLGRKICSCWGALARQKIEADPYRLISFLCTKNPLKTWEKIDDIAQTVFDIAIDDERRLHGAMMDSIFSYYDEQNTVISRETLLKKVKDRLIDGSLAKKAISSDYKSLAFLTNGDFWQARGAFLMEKQTAEMIDKLLRHRQFDMFGEQQLDDEAFRFAIAEFERQEGYPLGCEQVKAIKVSLNNLFIVITGGAGVGKTSVLKCLYHIIEKQGGRVVQMALAGRASRRMMEATGRPARTIAGFLANCRGEKLDEKTTVVIDESSMLCLPLMFQILKRIPRGCRLILVGDAEQLPPIGPGLVFHLLTKDLRGLVPISELTKVYRQDDTSGIPTVAKEIREQRWPELPFYSGKGKGVSVISATQYEVEDIVKRVYRELGGNDLDADVQILSVTKDTSPYGVGGINAYLQNSYATGKKRIHTFNSEFAQWDYTGGFAVGDPVMFNRNDWERDLFNGTLGHVIEAYNPSADQSEDPSLHVCARVLFDTGEQDITVGILEHLELAYSITVHKSQGSQFRRVIIPIKEGRILDKSLVYTAITRGVEQVVLIGNIEAAKAAVESGAAASKRQVGLGYLLNIIVKRDTGLKAS